MTVALDSIEVDSQARNLAETLDGLGMRPNDDFITYISQDPNVSFYMTDEPLEAIVVMKDNSLVEYAWRYRMWAFTAASSTVRVTP